MKKFLVFNVVLLLIGIHVFAADTTGINFRQMTLPQAVAQAKKENKMVFLHGYADWCGHCKTMAETIYPDPEVAEFYNKHFVSVKIDMEKEGKELASKYKITKYPGLLFFDGDGAVVHRTTGEQKKPDMLQLGKDAIDPEKQMRTFERKYKDGTATRDEVRRYFIMVERAGLNSQPELNKYFAPMTTEQMLEPENWRLIWDVLREPRLPLMKKFIDNKKAFEAKYTADSVNMKILSVYASQLMKYTQQLDTAGYVKLKKEIRATGLDIADKICDYADLNTFRLKGKYEDYNKAAPAFVQKHLSDDSRKLNEVAQQVGEHTRDTVLLLKAEGWAKQSIAILEMYRNYYTLAVIEHKLGKKSEAKKAADKAVEMGKKYGNDFKPAVLLLEKIEALP